MASGAVKTKEKPYVANYPPLAAWLKKHEARCMWQVPMGGTFDTATAYVEGWMFGGRIAILVVHANGMGWDVFTSGSDSRIKETLEDAEKRLGLEPDPA